MTANQTREILSRLKESRVFLFIFGGSKAIAGIGVIVFQLQG